MSPMLAAFVRVSPVASARAVPLRPLPTLVIWLPPASIPFWVMLGVPLRLSPAALVNWMPPLLTVNRSSPLPKVALFRSVKSFAMTRLSLPSLLSTRRLAPEAVALFARPPSMLRVSLSFLAMVSPVLPANLRPSAKVATSLSSMTMRVMPSLPSTPGVPSLTLMMPLVPSLPVRPMVPSLPLIATPEMPSLPLRPIEPSLPLMVTPEMPSAPLTPMMPSLPGRPLAPGPPTVTSLLNAKSSWLSVTVVVILLSVLVYLTVSPSLTVSLEPLSAAMLKPLLI